MKAFLIKLKSSPYFVVASSTFATFAAKAVYNWVQAGSPALSWADLKSTALAALGVVATALYHQFFSSSPADAAAIAAGAPKQ